MKVRFLVGCIASFTISGVPLLATLINPALAIADDSTVVRKVVLLDLYQRGTTNISPKVTKITFLDSYALATWFWGEGEGQSVLLNENDRWRVIVARSGGVKASYLVQSGIPLDLARTLISRDRGAPEKQPPVAELLAEVLPQLQQQTDALILLPSQMPLPEKPVYVDPQVRNDEYRLNLELQRDCGELSVALLVLSL